METVLIIVSIFLYIVLIFCIFRGYFLLSDIHKLIVQSEKKDKAPIVMEEYIHEGDAKFANEAK